MRPTMSKGSPQVAASHRDRFQTAPCVGTQAARARQRAD